MISRNVDSQAAPKEIVWWASSGRGSGAAPACRTTALGDHRSGTGRRGAAADQPVHDRQVRGEHDGVARQALGAARRRRAVARCRTAVTRPPRLLQPGHASRP